VDDSEVDAFIEGIYDGLGPTHAHAELLEATH
jgi:hypothetical protein